MKELIFATGNDEKFLTARQALEKHSIDLHQNDVQTTEIQEEDTEKVALDKAMKAFELIGKPLVITDDSWSFAGLRGFPGVYMHSMNQWFNPDDFLRLTLPLENRDVTLTIRLVYIDNTQHKVFTRRIPGTLLREIKGTSAHPSHTIIAMQGDDGLSIAEAYARATDKSSRNSAQIWQEFAVWFNAL